MLVYAVFKTGVYRHECGGIFETQAEAEATARMFIEKERDDYHDYEVVPFELGTPTKWDNPGITPNHPRTQHYDLYEADPVATFRRKDEGHHAKDDNGQLRWVTGATTITIARA